VNSIANDLFTLPLPFIVFIQIIKRVCFGWFSEKKIVSFAMRFCYIPQEFGWIDGLPVGRRRRHILQSCKTNGKHLGVELGKKYFQRNEVELCYPV
jgi:hypothetical protein